MILPVCLNATMDQTTNTAECVKKPRRRWFRFRLRTLLIGVAVLAIPCGYVAREVKIVRNRQAVRDRLKDSAFFIAGVGGVGSPAHASPKVPWLRQMMGDSGVLLIQLRKGDSGECDAVKAAFPEADVKIIE